MNIRVDLAVSRSDLRAAEETARLIATCTRRQLDVLAACAPYGFKITMELCAKVAVEVGMDSAHGVQSTLSTVRGRIKIDSLSKRDQQIRLNAAWPIYELNLTKLTPRGYFDKVSLTEADRRDRKVRKYAEAIDSLTGEDRAVLHAWLNAGWGKYQEAVKAAKMSEVTFKKKIRELKGLLDVQHLKIADTYKTLALAYLLREEIHEPARTGTLVNIASVRRAKGAELLPEVRQKIKFGNTFEPDSYPIGCRLENGRPTKKFEEEFIAAKSAGYIPEMASTISSTKTGVPIYWTMLMVRRKK